MTVQVPPAVGSSGQFIDSIVITSSTNRQIVIVGSPTSTSAHAPVTSAGMGVVSASSGLVQLTSAIAISSGTITSTAGTNPWSSAPGFNIPMVSASSGVVQVLTSGTLIAALTSGTVTLSSNPTVISASSGVVQVLTSGTLIVAMTSGTVTLSSNPTVISASSGNIGTFPSSGTLFSVYTFNASSSNSLVCVTTGAIRLYGWNFGNTATSAALAVRTYNSTTATAGSTSNLQVLIPIPGGSAGAGNNFMLSQGVSYSGGLTIIVAQTFSATSTGTNHSAGDVAGTLYYI